MSELHKFLFDGLPVRGTLVRLTGAWQEILQRRRANSSTGAYPSPVSDLLGELTAAAVLMQSSIKFNGTLILQIAGDGPVKLAVAEVQSDLSLRATATVMGEVPTDSQLSQMVNVNNRGRCAVILDPKDKLPGQQPYQGVVPLFDDQRQPIEKISSVIEHYMLQSEQLDTTLVLAANDAVAAGLLIQCLPVQGEGNLAGSVVSRANEDEIGLNEHYNRLALFAKSLKREELLGLDANEILHRLFWEESIIRYAPNTPNQPQFACSCSRQRVSSMILSLGQEEVASILAERGDVEVSCEFCGQQERFDPVDAAQIFMPADTQPPADSPLIQ
ncbi:MAG: Hsp33 family molecular chaperone HslO [Burkholderiaceae bacterium]|nr:Hsp33 family molecular chaperone HslO [Burkholderiaceae bacterium]